MGRAHADGRAAGSRAWYIAGMRSYLFLSITLGLGVAACELKDSGDTDGGDDSSGSAASDSAGTTTGGSDGTGQSSNGGGSSATTTEGTTGVGTATATATSTEGTGMTSSSTSATSASTSATTDGPPPDPIEPTPCEGEAKIIPGEAIAYLESQVPPAPPPDTTGGSSGTTGGEPVDPGTLHVRLSSQTLTCDDPAATLKCGSNWAVSFALAPEFQAPGLYHLSGPQVFGVGTETGPDEGGGECSWGGGSFFATLEVIAVDDDAVTGRLCHIDAPIPGNAAELEGKFVAARCPG